MNITTKLSLIGLLSLVLINCGGSGTENDAKVSGIDGTGGPENPELIQITSVGVISNTDKQLLVNGVRFALDDTQITINNENTSEPSALAKGQIVLVKGTLKDDSNGTANEVIHKTNINGPISELNTSKKTIIVLGQTIVLSNDLIWGENLNSFNDLKQGDTVQVSGFKLANGDLSATRIDSITANAYSLIGKISQLNTIDQQFKINDLIVNYRDISTAPLLSDGMTVEIYAQAFNTQGHALATAITQLESTLGDTEQQIQLEGFITEFKNPSEFTIGDVSINTSRQTIFIGNTRDNLELNTRVEIEGYLNDDGTLQAEKLIFLVADIISHKPSSTLPSSTVTFEWGDVNATAYHLVIKNNYNHQIFYDKKFDGNTTSATITGLPENNAAMTLFLYTQHGEFWYRKYHYYYGFKSLESAVLTSHDHGDTLSSTDETFTWNAVPGVEQYRFIVFDYFSNTVYHDEFYPNAIPVTVNNLPDNGADIVVLVWSQYKGWWVRTYDDLISVQLVENASLTSHTDKQTLSTNSQTFTWNDVGAEQYELRLVTRDPKGWFQIFHQETYDGSTTSATINDLPINGAEILFRLRTKHSGWASKHYTFTGPGLVSDAELNSHVNFGQLTSDVETFSWNEVTEAEEYHLKIKSYTLEGRDFFDEDYDTYITQETISGLPQNGAEFFLSLSTKVNGFWAHKHYRLKGSGTLQDANITSHTSYETITTPTTTISWDNVASDGYRLIVSDRSTTPKVVVHDQIYDKSTTSALIENLPKNANNLFVEIFTNHDDWWAIKRLILKTNISD